MHSLSSDDESRGKTSITYILIFVFNDHYINFDQTYILK